MEVGYHYWGMHMMWWIFWILLVFAMFLTPWRPRVKQKEYLLNTLRKTYAEGKISTEEYEERKKIIERDAQK